MKTSSTSYHSPQCPWPFSVVVSPSQAQVLEVESREAGGGAKQRKKKHRDVGVPDCPGSSLSLLETSTCSEPRSPETKKPKLSQVPVASLLVLDHDHDTIMTRALFRFLPVLAPRKRRRLGREMKRWRVSWRRTGQFLTRT